METDKINNNWIVQVILFDKDGAEVAGPTFEVDGTYTFAWASHHAKTRARKLAFTSKIPWKPTREGSPVKEFCGYTFTINKNQNSVTRSPILQKGVLCNKGEL